jgi:poly-gamma-glutamate capsule biosynthesis protein CapA/YwtB (metallophosphatase superfamily)
MSRRQVRTRRSSWPGGLVDRGFTPQWKHALGSRSVARSMRPRRLGGVVLAAALLGVPSAAGCGSSTATGTPSPADPAVEVESSATPSTATQDIVLAFAGDVHFAERTTALLDDPATAFGPVASVFTKADLAVVNLETAVTEGGTAEPKKYHFRAPAQAFAAVKAAGVDAVSVANNHTLDYGPVGLADTLQAAEDTNMPAFGAGMSAEQAYRPWFTEVKGTKIALVGISQVHELEASWNATDTRPGVAHARDPERALAAVRQARERADVVVVFMHWGKEGSDCPTAEMRSFAGKLADAGATMIVGTHAHLLLGDGWLGGAYVAYGLGNFLWWWNDAYSNDTGVLRVTLRQNKITKTELVPAYISRTTGQPLPVTGTEADRITTKFAGLRGCTGLADAPS